MSRISNLLDPLNAEEFFEAYWERQPLILPNADQSRFDELFSLQDADRILTTGALNYPAIRLARGGTRLDSSEFTFANGRIDPLAVTKLFADGATVILDQLQETVPALRDLCTDLERELGVAFHTNIYVTPAQAQGFKVHYDTHDVFILQVAGAKEWETFCSPIELPLSGQLHDEEGRVPGEPLVRFRLEPGHVAYLPRGIYHQAVSDDETSVHITLGVVERNWCSLMLEAVAEASLREVEFRRALPLRFGLPDFDLSSAEAEFRRLWALLGERIDFAAVARSYSERAICSQGRHMEGQLLQIVGLSALSDQTILVARPQRVILVDGPDGAITVEAPSIAVTFPKEARPAVVALLSGQQIRLSDVPGKLESAGRLTLARRMIREGLVQAFGDVEAASRFK